MLAMQHCHAPRAQATQRHTQLEQRAQVCVGRLSKNETKSSLFHGPIELIGVLLGNLSTDSLCVNVLLLLVLLVLDKKDDDGRDEHQ